MRSMRVAVVAAALGVVVPAGVRAQSPVSCIGSVGLSSLAATPSLLATGLIGQQVLDFLPCLQIVGKTYVIDATFVTALAQGTVHVTMNPDPFVNFSLATTALVPGPTFMQFTFGTPIVPGFYNTATSSLAGSLTAGRTSSSVANSGTIPFLTGNGTVGGVPAPPSTPGNLGVDIGFGPCTTTSSTNCPASPASGANTFAPTFYDDLDATVTYLQSGTQSQATFSGRVDLTLSAVPEPSTGTLVAAGAVLGLAGGVVRRRRSA